MVVTGFNVKKLHTYCNAKVNGKWYPVSHFAKFDNWLVWLSAAHGYMSGFVDVAKVEAWEVPND